MQVTLCACSTRTAADAVASLRSLARASRQRRFKSFSHPRCSPATPHRGRKSTSETGQPLWTSRRCGETGRRSSDPVEGPAGHWHVRLVSTVSGETLAPLPGTQPSQLVWATVRRHSIASFPDSRSGLGSGLYIEASPFGSLPHQVWSL